jgi:Fe2+ transport system protein FeoA
MVTKKTIDITETADQELSAIPAGRRVQLVRILAGLALKERLAAMGLIPQGFFRIIRNEGQGQVIVEIKGVRVILGRGMSGKIRVRSLD